MDRTWSFKRWVLAMLMVAAPSLASAQSANVRLSIARTSTNLVVSWTGTGTLQSATSANGPWRDVLEGTSPWRVIPTGLGQLYRVLSRWGTRASLLEANSEMAVAELDGKIYVLGGYPASRVTVRTVQVYDTATDRWSLTTPMPIPLNHQMATAVNGRLYVIGGQTTDSGTGSFTNTVYEFNPATSNWTAKASMPTSRSAGASAVIGNLIYVAGGRPPRGADFAVYDTSSNRWTTLPNMPTARNHLAACAIGGKVYVVGGRLGGGFTSPMTNILEVFDPATSMWSTRAPMPTTRGGINGIAVDGCFFIFGGEGPNGVFDEMEMYVQSQNRWYSLESLPVAIHGVTGAALVNGWIHMPGGGTSTGGSSGSRLHQVFWVGGVCP